MTRFNIDQHSEQPDRILVEVDHRLAVVLIRTEAGLEFVVYPRTNDELWDEPYAVFAVDEREVIALERELA